MANKPKNFKDRFALRESLKRIYHPSHFTYVNTPWWRRIVQRLVP